MILVFSYAYQFRFKEENASLTFYSKHLTLIRSSIMQGKIIKSIKSTKSTKSVNSRRRVIEPWIWTTGKLSKKLLWTLYFCLPNSVLTQFVQCTFIFATIMSFWKRLISSIFKLTFHLWTNVLIYYDLVPDSQLRANRRKKYRHYIFAPDADNSRSPLDFLFYHLVFMLNPLDLNFKKTVIIA